MTMTLIIDWMGHPVNVPIGEDRALPLSIGGDIWELNPLREIKV